MKTGHPSALFETDTSWHLALTDAQNLRYLNASSVLFYRQILRIPDDVGNTISLYFTDEKNKTLRSSLWTQVPP